jgi:hypothetical protein
MRGVGVLVENASDGRVGPVQYQARWIDKEQQLRMLLVPHLGHTSMMVIIILSFSK